MLGYLFFLITKERYGGSIYRTKLILKILQYAEDIPISTRELGNIINLDNKTILNVFRKFQKVGLAQKRGNIGWVVTKEGRSIFINVEIDKPSLQYIIRIIKTNYYFKSFNYWRSILQSNIGSCIVPKILYYHWYDEENSKYVNINNRKFQKYLDSLKEKLNAKSDRDLSLRLGFEEKIIRLYRLNKRNPSIYFLKILCDKLNISYSDFENKRLFGDPYYPVKIPFSKIMNIRTHTLNEGSMTRWNVQYHNLDPVLLYDFYKNIRSFTDQISVPILTNNEGDIYITTRYLIPRVLNMLGLSYGSHSSIDLNLHSIQHNRSYFKNHLRITMAEEGILDMKIQSKSNKRRYCDLCIGLSRTVDVTNLFSKKEISDFQDGFILFSKLDIDIQDRLLKYRSRLLDSEISTLYRLFVPSNLWIILPMPRPISIHKSNKNKITLRWAWRTYSNKIIDIFYSEIGVLAKTRAQHKFNTFYEFWKKIRGNPLSNVEVKRAEKIIEKFKRKGPDNHWISSKFNELFPGVLENKELNQFFQIRKNGIKNTNNRTKEKGVS